jgi:hypothetical protein
MVLIKRGKKTTKRSRRTNRITKKKNPRYNPDYERMKEKQKRVGTYLGRRYTFPSEIVKAFNVIKTWTEGITAGHIEKRDGRDWTIHEQLCHVQSEITEVYEAIRWSKCDKEITEEMVDIVLSAFTLFNIYRSNKLRAMPKLTYDMLVDVAVNDVVSRVQGRLKDNNYNMGSRVGKLEE